LQYNDTSNNDNESSVSQLENMDMNKKEKFMKKFSVPVWLVSYGEESGPRILGSTNRKIWQ